MVVCAIIIVHFVNLLNAEHYHSASDQAKQFVP